MRNLLKMLLKYKQFMHEQIFFFAQMFIKLYWLEVAMGGWGGGQCKAKRLKICAFN